MRGRRSAARRFGGYDEIELSDAERIPLGWWSQHWLWFSQGQSVPLDRPAPGLEINQTDELPPFRRGPMHPPAPQPSIVFAGRLARPT